MKCEKCGHINSPYSIVCEKCEAPLKIEENKLLQEKYHDKGKHIDIEEIVEEKNSLDFNRTRKNVFRGIILVVVLFTAFFLYFLASYLLDEDSKAILDTYSDYVKNSSLALFYFGDDEEVDSICNDYSSNYGFEYLNIQVQKISKKSRRKIQEELNIYNVTSALVVVKSGVPIVSMTHIEKEKITEFLQKNELIPMYLENPLDQLEEFKKANSSANSVLLYLPTSYQDTTNNSSESLKSIASQYNLEYHEVKGYLLSKRQLLKLMTQLGYSEIQKDLILYIVDGKVEKTIEDVEKKSYFQLLSSYGIIDTSSANYLITISYDKFLELTKMDKGKQVILIGSDNCIACERVKPILGQIAEQNQIVIYYLNATNNLDNISKRITELGIEGGLTNTPFLLIVEKNKGLDYIVGQTTKNLYQEKLTELGVIR